MMKMTTRATKTMMMMRNYQVEPASNVYQLKLEEVEEDGGQVLAQSSQVSRNFDNVVMIMLMVMVKRMKIMMIVQRMMKVNKKIK